VELQFEKPERVISFIPLCTLTIEGQSHSGIRQWFDLWTQVGSVLMRTPSARSASK
jgi:hypothetical protein